MDFKLELVLVPVTDVDRAKAFYTENAGFNLDVDHRAGDNFRVVQMTPPGSACSITELVERGVEVSEIRHHTADGWVTGPHPERSDYNSFADFSDPDGNSWVMQERRGEQGA